MPREIKIIGKSYNKFGERLKKLLDIDIAQGLSCVSVKGNKLILMIDDYVNNKTRIIHYDIINDTITLDQTLDNLVFWIEWRIFPISNNLSFLDYNGNYYKYDKSTNSYSIINLGISPINQFQFLEDKILTISWDGFNIYDLNGNLITSISIGGDNFTYDKTSNKVYKPCGYPIKICEIDLSNYSYRTIDLPSDTFITYGLSFRRKPNTNKFLFVDSAHYKIYELDLDTLEISTKVDLLTTELSQSLQMYGLPYAFISEDCKLVFLIVLDIGGGNFLETWVYDLEKNQLKLVLSTDYPYFIVGNDTLKRYLIKDAPYGYVIYIYDYNKDKITGVIKNYSWYDIRIDGNIWCTL